jgi:hypothetical protein
VRSFEAQGETDQASRMRERFEKAWERADLRLDTSRLMAGVARK